MHTTWMTVHSCCPLTQRSLCDFRWICSESCHFCAVNKWTFSSSLNISFLFPKEKSSHMQSLITSMPFQEVSGLMTSFLLLFLLRWALPCRNISWLFFPSFRGPPRRLLHAFSLHWGLPESWVSVLSSFPQGSWNTKEEGWQRHQARIWLPHCCSEQHWLKIA